MSRIKIVCFSLIPLVLILAVGEIVSRYVCYMKFHKYQTDISIQGEGSFAGSVFTVWTNRPNYLYPDGSFSYNEHGMRVPPGMTQFPEKGKDDFYVFLLGGSAMAGMGSNLNGEWVRITGVGTHPVSEAIDGYLEAKLQRAMPEKHVHVFNAAVASHTIVQTRMQYDLLKHLRPDWVISMDGVNDAIFDFRNNTSEYSQLIQFWNNNPVNNFPFVQGRFFMRNSALCYLLGEYIFFRTGLMRNKINTKQDKNVLKTWLNKVPVITPPREPDEATKLQVEKFIANAKEFQAVLVADKQKHLMLIQPETSMRNYHSITNDIEKAVYNYRASGTVSAPSSYMNLLYSEAHRLFSGCNDIFPMDSLHKSTKWIFVDYCHFSKEANEVIAEEISKYILSDGSYKPFVN